MIPLELQKLNRWVCCTDESKIPYKSWTYDTASSSNPKTWSDYEMAKQAVDNGYYSWLGFVFTAQDGYVGIDIDIGYENGLISQTACEIIKLCESYTEKSKSGRGFHIILKGSLPFSGKNNRAGIEIYNSARFFVMTGNTLIYDKIIYNQKAIDLVLTKYFREDRFKTESVTHSNTLYKPIWEKPGSLNGKIPHKPFYPPITKGSRNATLLSIAGSLLTAGYSKTNILQELMIINKTACKPPLNDSEVLSITNSIMKYKRK